MIGHQIDWRERIVEFYLSPEYRQLADLYARKNLFDILGIARNEQYHSRMLRWVLDPSETHGLGTFPLRKFLQAIALAKIKYIGNKSENLSPELLEAFVTESCRIDDARVWLEQSTGNKRGRVDLVAEVEMKIGNKEKTLPIVLENKVETNEHSQQTEKYKEWAEEEYSDRGKYFTPVYLFLTPATESEIRTDRSNGCSCKEFIHLNYQLLCKLVFGPCLEQIKDDSAKVLLSDYIRCLSYADIAIAPSEKKDNSAKARKIMAIGTVEKQLLLEFWRRHKELVYQAILADHASDEETEEADSGILLHFWDKNQNLLVPVLDILANDETSLMSDEQRENIKRTLKARQKFLFDGQVVVGKAALVRSVVEKVIKQEKVKYFAKVKELFPDKYGVNSDAGLVQRGDWNSFERYRIGEMFHTEYIPLDSGEKVYVWRAQWSDDKFNKFLKYVKDKFPYSIERV